MRCSWMYVRISYFNQKNDNKCIKNMKRGNIGVEVLINVWGI